MRTIVHFAAPMLLVLVACSPSGGADSGNQVGPDGSALPPDGGSPDAHVPDAGRDASVPPDAAMDAGQEPDASAPDGSTVDSGRSDAGVADASAAPDAAGPDGGERDAGLPPCARAAHDLPGVTSFTQGRFTTLSNVPATALGNTRRVVVWSPQGSGPFPVLYAHDGQNQFDDAQASFGVAWGMDEVASAMEGLGLPFIVVAVDNNANRMGEYTPVSDPEYGGGQGDAYLDFLAHDLKPLIDHRFPTRCEPAHTAMIGSSLGGLISLHASHTLHEVFGRFAVMSPSLWWNNGWPVNQFLALAAADPVILWLDGGSDEALQSAGVSPLVLDLETLVGHGMQVGHVFGQDLGYLEAERAAHNEWAWQHRLFATLMFIMGPRGGAPSFGHIFIHNNPWNPHGQTRAVFQAGFSDGRMLSVPAVLAPLQSQNSNVATVQGAAISTQSAGSSQISGSYLGISASTELRVQNSPQSTSEVIFEVTVPEATSGPVFLTGSVAALGNWDPAAVPMTQQAGRLWRTAVMVQTGSTFEYKFTRGTWPTVEVSASGADIPNRSGQAPEPLILYDEVVRWHP